MNGTRIAATVVASVIAMSVFEAWIKPRIQNAVGNDGGSQPSDTGASTSWPM